MHGLADNGIQKNEGVLHLQFLLCMSVCREKEAYNIIRQTMQTGSKRDILCCCFFFDREVLLDHLMGFSIL